MDDTVDPPARRLRRLNLVAAAAFVLGGSLFALGAALAQIGTAGETTVNVTYLVGGVFFTTGGAASVLLAASPEGRTRAWWSAVVLLVGTLFFAVSLVAAFAEGLTPRQSNGWMWFPDITGCLCFLASGHLALTELAGRRTRRRDDAVPWAIAVVNQVGSVLFFLAGLAAFIRPATDEAINIGLVNWGTFAGALCFAVAGAAQAFDTPTPTGTVTTHDTAH